MKSLENLSYCEHILLQDDLEYQGYRQQIHLSKHSCDSDPKDRYYLKTNILTERQEINRLGYLYFYLDQENAKSEFIGVGVNDSYRNSGVASLLISSWIKFCLDSEINHLQTTAKQRKPFILHLLKKYEFEIKNIEKYLTSTKTIHLCRKNGDNNKYLVFNDANEEDRFRRSNIMKTDNYKIIENNTENIEIFDTVNVNCPYFLQDNNKAYQKSLITINSHKG